MLAVHVVAYLGLLMAALPIGTALLVIVVHQALFGIHLGCAFTPNHKGMPTRTGSAGARLPAQAGASRRATCAAGASPTPCSGGLNHQIEHHLFPSMPCASLSQARPIVRDFCLERGIGYEEVGLLT